MMIIINDSILLENKEDVEDFNENLKNLAHNDITEKTYDVMADYFLDCYYENLRLEKMVKEYFGEEIFPILYLNFGECDDFNEFNFSLGGFEEEVVPKKRDELRFQEFCDICFGNVAGLGIRLDKYFEDYEE